MDPINKNTPLRLLLVEDNKHDVLAFKRALKDGQLAHQLTHYEQAEPALARLAVDAAAFDLVICDYNLPGMSGFELCQTLLQQNIALPLVLLTGSGAESLAVDAIKIGVSDYIVKDLYQGYLSLLPVVLPDVVRRHNDRLSQQRMEALLAKRERYLAALVKVQQQLLALGNDDTFYNGILAPLGQAANANRVYVFQNEVDATARRIAAWYAPEINPHCAKSLPQHLSYEAQLPRWATTLSQKKIIVGNVESFPEPEQKFLAVQNIQSILILPLIVNGQFFGFIGFDQCVEVRTWEPAEIDLLQAAAAGISLWQERRQAEAKLHQYTTQLKAHNAELDAFAHTVAHDLKNPLTALTGVAEILATTHMSSEVLNEYLGAIVRGGRKALSIVEELLVLASVRQQEDIALERLEMGAIVAETQERLRYMISEAEAQIILPKTWPVALGYAPWIEEIWANYLSNALKYGGQPPLITLGASIQNNGQIRFWVHDNGLGLAEAEQDQLFTRFTQLKQTRAKGHGLGLSIVRRIATKLGGEVGVESQSVPGQGSTFYFTLPRAEGKGED